MLENFNYEDGKVMQGENALQVSRLAISISPDANVRGAVECSIMPPELQRCALKSVSLFCIMSIALRTCLPEVVFLLSEGVLSAGEVVS